MRKNLKKLLSLVMTLSIVMSMLSVNVAAEETNFESPDGAEDLFIYKLVWTGEEDSDGDKIPGRYTDDVRTYSSKHTVAYNFNCYHNTDNPYEDPGYANNVTAGLFDIENTVTGESFAAYCCDFVNSALGDHLYRRLNLEQANSYFSTDDAAWIRGIMNNGYWHDWTEDDDGNVVDSIPEDVLDNVNEWLRNQGEEPIDVLTADQAMAATQLAVWIVANQNKNSWYGYKFYLTPNVSREEYDGPVLGNYKVNECNTPEAVSTIEKFRDYLLAQKAEPVTRGDVAFTDDYFVVSDAVFADSETDAEGNVIYNITLTIKLAADIDPEQDDLVLKAAIGEVEKEYALTGENYVEAGENDYYTITFSEITKEQAENGIALTLAGYQYINGVYFYQAKANGEDNYNGSRGASQNLVGRYVGEHPVFLEKTIDVDVDEDEVEVALTKQNDSDAPLAGAKFNLYAKLHNDDNYIPVKRGLVTDGEGKIVVGDLPANYTYYFKEIEAPVGYVIEDSSYITAGTVDNPAIVTNDIETVEISVTKVWEDHSNEDKVRPNEVTVQLMKNGTAIDTLILNESNQWKGSFTDLPKYDFSDGVKEIEYTIQEADVDGYTAEITWGEGEDKYDFTVTNCHEVLTDVSVEKKWEDTENHDGLRPQSVTVHLLADGEVIEGSAVTLSGENSWKHTWKDLSKYSGDEAITYEVREVEVPEGYDVGYSVDGTWNFTVTNTHAPEKVNIKAEKVWDDKNDQDGIRPESVQVQFYIDDVASGDPVTLNEDNDWTYEWTNLAKYHNGGVEIKYHVEEVAVPDGYEASVDGYVITNTHKPATVEVMGSKTWNDNDDQDGKRPESITINLLADGEKVKSKTVTAADDWKWSFTDLPKNDNGQEIDYTITEDEVKYYTSEVKGYDVTNTHETEKTSVSGKKTWKDKDNYDGLRPENITINLLADGVKIQSKTVTEADGWKWSFTGLDKYDNGKEIVYTITEEKVEGYEATIDGYDVTNTHEVEKVKVEGEKTWSDNNDQDGLRPESITINLLADGEKIDSKVVTSADGWKWSWTGLDKYKGGKAINYTITEDAVPGYSAEVKGYDVTNTHETEDTQITVKKVWKDDGNRDGIRPASISVQLLADGAAKGEPVTLTAENGWTYTWNGLDQMSGGKTISYTVAEVGTVEGYTSSVNGFTITNTHEVEKTSVSGSKTWKDSNDQDGKRPASITINLLADGEKIDSKVVTAADGWKWNFTDLPKNANGQPIHYTITEDAVPGYSTEVNGYDVTNSYTPGKTSVTVNKVWKDDGNRDGIRPASISVQLLADGAAKGEPVTLTAENGWTYTWTGLDEMSGGKSISYSVAEVGTVAGYTSSVNGFTITNTHEVEKTSIDVEKVWERTSNPPEIDVIIKLLADGEEVKTLKLNEDNEWKGTFSDLPVNKDGKAITYTIEEVEVSGYTTKITGSAADGFTVTNTKEGDRPNDEEEEDEPSGGPKDVTYTLKADKTLDGKKANGFTFQVKDADGDVVATASAKSGKITFPAFRYDTEGTYTYTVSEVAGTNSNVTYDDSVYTLTVTVSKSGEELAAECTGLMKDGEAVESILFENTYDGERFYDDDEEELFEEDIPLGGLAAPETGDAGMLWALTAAVSGMGLAGLNFFPKKRKEDEE